MKNITLTIIGLLFLFLGCTGVKTISTGLENEAFLEFIGNPKQYKDGVNVTIDDKINFVAEVKKDYAKRPKGFVYAITTGTHVISVASNNEIIYQKQFYIAAQETKKIILP